MVTAGATVLLGFLALTVWVASVALRRPTKPRAIDQVLAEEGRYLQARAEYKMRIAELEMKIALERRQLHDAIIDALDMYVRGI